MKVTRVAEDVHMVTGTNVNWALVVEGSAVTLVDAGYPNDVGALLDSIAAVGRRPQDVVAIVLTHAHLDHVGGVPAMVRRFGTPVFTGMEEARHARREYLDQITPGQLLMQCRDRAGRRWVGQTLRAALPNPRVALDDVTVAEEHIPLDIPGRLVPVPTPGHTRGHTAYLMPSGGVFFSGDTLVTGHPISRAGTGPQKLPAVFNENDAAVSAAIRSLRDVPADTLVPGHGELLRGPLSAIAGEALERTP
jgi:glyoxylase-like metal-dependent hydrolase (beta-lactamase superfamily II)